MYFPRRIDAVLQQWHDAADRKPLVLRGARQTGKSSSVRQLGKACDLFLELNLERFEDLRLVRGCRSPKELMQALAARNNVETFPEKTLLFLDEIQESPEAIQWLRFFYEEHPELAVVAAGSLMEVRLREKGFSFPVGRVTFRYLHPVTFLEFLEATGRSVLRDQLAGAVRCGEAPSLAVHEEALNLLRHFLLVGGMPAAVGRWVEVGQLAAVSEVHRDLLQAFAEDIPKYREGRDTGYLEAAFENLGTHYGARFRYESFAPGFRSRQMKTALGKLESAMLITTVLPTSSFRLPMTKRARSAPKLLPLDIGLGLGSMGTGFQAFAGQPLARVLAGHIAEILCGTQFVAGNVGRWDPLYFWVSESSRANSEVDFLLPGALSPVPVEVKAGASGALKSLHQFLWKANLRRALRLHAGPFADQVHSVRMPTGDLVYRLTSIPLWAAELVPELAAGMDGTELGSQE